MYQWGSPHGDIIAYQFESSYQTQPPLMSLRPFPWRRVVERLIGQLTSGALAPTGPAVLLSGTDGKCAPERNDFI